MQCKVGTPADHLDETQGFLRELWEGCLEI